MKKSKEVPNKKRKTPLVLFILFVLFFRNIIFFFFLFSFAPTDNVELEDKERTVNWIPESNKFIEGLEYYEGPTKDGEIKYDIENLSIDFLEEPELVKKQFDFFKPYTQEGKEIDPDDDSFHKVYITGTVITGTIAGNNLAGYTSYLLNDTIRILHNDKKNITYFLTELSMYQYSFVEANPNVHGLSSNLIYPMDVFVNSLFETNDFVESDKGHKYRVLSGFEYISEDMLEVVDTVGGHNIYLKVIEFDGLMYVRNKDGTYSGLEYQIPFREDSSNNLVTFKTTKGFDFTASYTTYNWSACGAGLPLVSPSNLSLEKVGTIPSGDSLYRDKDGEGESGGMYYEYIKTSTYMYNKISEDDETPYTLEQFENSYPVIYWESPFGFFVKLVREDYIPARGCHIPSNFQYK